MDLHLVPMIVLQFLVIGFCQASVVTHTLQYNYTAVTHRINFTDFTFEGLLDGEQFVSYDGNKMKVIPTMKWIQKISAYYPYYWNSKAQRIQTNLEDLHHLLRLVMKEFNHTEGVHSLQWMYRCELDDDGTTRGYNQYKYDGEDFISLDLNTETWTVDNDKAVIVKHMWKETGVKAKDWKYYPGYKCINRLRKFVSYRRETLERKSEVYKDTGVIHQEFYLYCTDIECLMDAEVAVGSGSGQYWSVLGWPVIITLLVVGFFIILIVILLGFVIWMVKKNKSGYLPTPNSHMTSSKIQMPNF